MINSRWVEMINRIFDIFVFGIFVFVIFVANVSEGQEMLKLVDNGKANTIIVVPDRPNGAQLDGARILASHLYEISGAKVDVIEESELGYPAIRNGRIMPDCLSKNVNTFVFVGEGDFACYELKVNSESLGVGGIRMKTVGNALVLIGKDNNFPGDRKCVDNRYEHWSWGTRYAVITFLEKYLGVRYLWPGEIGKVVPKRKSVVVPRIDYQFTPMLKQRQIRRSPYSGRAQKGLDWLRISKCEYLSLKRRARQTKAYSGNWFCWQRLGGTLGLIEGDGFILPEELWKRWPKEHPNWFAMQLDGSRSQIVKGHLAERPRLCVSNKELIKAIAKLKIEELKSHPDRKSVSIEVNDGGYIGFCMCPQCKKLDVPSARRVTLWSYNHKEEKIEYFPYVSLTDRMIHFYNEIAKLVTKECPDALLCISQYSVYSSAPIKNRLHPNLVVRFVGEWYERDSSRQIMMADWKSWSQMASKIFFRPNLLYMGYKQGNLLTNYTHKFAEDFRYMAHHSMLGTDFDGCLDMWSTQGLNYYVVARLMWEPDKDVDEIIDDYCKSGFGKGWREIRKYWDTVESLTNKVASSEDMEFSDVYTPEAIGRLSSLLDNASKKAEGTNEILKRIDFLRSGLKFTDLQARARRLAKRIIANPKDKKLKAEGQKMQDRRWKFMRRLFRKYPLSIDVAFEHFYSERNFYMLGRNVSAELLRLAEQEARFKGRGKTKRNSNRKTIEFIDEKGRLVE